MSVVDAPPGLDFGGPALGEFLGRRRPRLLARSTLILCLFDGAITYALTMRNLHAPGTSMLFVGPLMCLSFAAVGLAVRSARVRVDQGGLYWGWNILGGRVSRDQIDRVDAYAGGIVMILKQARLWYLSAYDWDRFDAMPEAFVDAKIDVLRRPGSPPWRARMKAYGVFLDGMMVLTLMVSTALLLFAALR